MLSNEDDKNDETLMPSNEDDENDETLMSSKDEDKNAKKQKPVPIPKKMRMKACCQNIWKALIINCLKNKVMVKMLTVL